ncbi:MAG: hypothetical protein M1816_005906 [Peltula sp. TS41687]|nr:MAG: hypothetical protein M1816_005906 [Peltula sp. TS41687]
MPAPNTPPPPPSQPRQPSQHSASIVLNQVDSELILDPDNSTVYTATTPPETIATDLPDDHDPFGGAKSSSSSVPWLGSTFIIRCVSSGHVITLLDGQIVLARPGGRGSIHWACVETKGWFGFRNPVSGRFLGHDAKGRLRCLAERHQGWENFCVRMRLEGGYVLLMTHYESLWHVGIKVEQEVEKLAKIGYEGSDGIVWEFVEV